MHYPSLNFGLGETIDMLREQTRNLVDAELAPRAAEIDRENQFPQEMWRRFGDMGLLGITVSEEYGGNFTQCLAAAKPIEVCRENYTVVCVAGYLFDQQRYLRPQHGAGLLAARGSLGHRCGGAVGGRRAAVGDPADRRDVAGDREGGVGALGVEVAVGVTGLREVVGAVAVGVPEGHGRVGAQRSGLRLG